MFAAFGTVAVRWRVPFCVLQLVALAGVVLVGLGVVAAGVGDARAVGFGSRHGAERLRSGLVRGVVPPGVVAVALRRTDGARYVVVREGSQLGSVRFELDSRHDRVVTWVGGRVSLVQVGRRVYAPRGRGSCFLSGLRASGLLPNVAGMLLPSGTAAVRYASSGRTVRWSVVTPRGFRPRGIVRVDRSGRIVAATIYSGPGVPLTATVTYPSRIPAIYAPRNVCARHGA